MTNFGGMRAWATIASLLLSASCIAQTYFPPAVGDWETVDAVEALGWCPDRLDSLDAFMAAHGTRVLVILHNGRIAHEAYYNGAGVDSVWYWASAGKTVTSALVGVLASEGLLDLTDATSDWLGGGWTSLAPEQEAAIQIRHQLTMTTGLNDGTGEASCTLPACLTFLEPAGERWAYHNGPYTLLTDVVEAAAGQPLNVVLFNRIRQAIGMTAVYATLPGDPYDRVVVSRGRDMARFGLLASQNFIWNGDTLITDASYLDGVFAATQPHNACYGHLWWLNDDDSHMLPSTQLVFDGPLVPNGPPDLRMALGKNDQKIHIAPSAGLVIVRMGESAGETALAASSFDNQIWAHLNLLSLGCGTCPFDLDGDGVVAVGDVLVFLGGFGGDGPEAVGDFNGDGGTTTADLLALLGAFGSAC